MWRKVDALACSKAAMMMEDAASVAELEPPGSTHEAEGHEYHAVDRVE